MASDTYDLNAILSQDDIDVLQTGYDSASMNAVAAGAVKRYDPGEGGHGVAAWGTWIVDRVYEGPDSPDPSGPRMARVDRERCLIAINAAKVKSMPLAVHAYWGLMEGLSPTQIVQTLNLAGIYGGIDAFTDGGRVLKTTFDLLVEQAAASRSAENSDDAAAAVNCMSILGLLLQKFPA